MAMKKPMKKGDEPVRVASKAKQPAGSKNPGKNHGIFTKSRNEEVADALKEGNKKYGKTNFKKTWEIDLNAGGFGIPRPVKKKK